MSKYTLNIHHRDAKIVKNKAGNYEIERSPVGHFYVSLQEENKEPAFFGKYPQEGFLNSFVGPGEIHTDREGIVHDELVDKDKKLDTKHVYTKSVALNESEYHKALAFAKANTDGQIGDNSYFIGSSDCRHFVQDVWLSTGRSLPFTVLFSTDELRALDTKAASNLLHNFGSRDVMEAQELVIHDMSKEEIARSFNLAIDAIQEPAMSELLTRTAANEGIPTMQTKYFKVAVNPEMIKSALVGTSNLAGTVANATDNAGYKFEIVHINDVSSSSNTQNDDAIKNGRFIIRLKKDTDVISIMSYKDELDNNSHETVANGIQVLNSNDNSNHVKVLNINAEQYSKIVKYLEDGIKYNKAQILNKDTASTASTGSNYAVSAKDSAELVQELYNKAGLPMYFTAVYSKKEFDDLKSADATKAAKEFNVFVGNSSNKITAYADSRDELAAKLNIDPKYIKLASDGRCVTLCTKGSNDERGSSKFIVKMDKELLQNIASIIGNEINKNANNTNMQYEDLVQEIQNVFLSHKIPPELPKDQLSHLDQNTNFSTLKSQISNVLSHSKSIFDKLLGKVDQQAAESNNSGHSIYTQDQVKKLFMEKYEALQKEFSNAHNKTSSGLLIYNNTVTPKAQKIFQEKELALSTWISDELAKIPGTPQYLQTHQSSDKTPAVSSKTHHDKIVTSWNKEIDTARTKDFFNDKIDKSLNNPNKAIADLDKEFDIFLQGASSELHVDLESL